MAWGSTSTALYGQVTWTPPILDHQLQITLGLRHSVEEKSGTSVKEAFDFTLNTEHTDPAITFHYHWHDTISTYAKWSRAYRSGGANSRSPSLQTFDQEEVDTAELGLKVETWAGRLRLNAALFSTNFKGMFIDVLDANDVSITDTINAAKEVTIDGAEFDLTVLPIAALTLGLSYTYLDGDMPLQPNPLADNALESFLLTQTPQHSGALTLDYHFASLPQFGTLIGHLDITSTASQHHWPSGGIAHPDAYTLFNARLELADIPIVKNHGSLTLSLWGKNLTDEEYVIMSSNSIGASTLHAFGEPRTAGIDLVYTF